MSEPQAPPILETRALNLWYGEKHALQDIHIAFAPHEVTALIGPSGCGKSSLIRCFNRMNDRDLLPGARISGEVLFRGADLYAPGIDAAHIRFQIGMIFQKPNLFPKSIYDNVAFGLRVNGFRGNERERVVEALKKAALWNEVQDRLHRSAMQLSGGQQQRLCIARAIAVNPHVLLMDEPCSSLDPIATEKIEELIGELVHEHTVIMVTHNMQQASRVSQRTAFLFMGELVEVGETKALFTNPTNKRTEDYITGRFG